MPQQRTIQEILLQMEKADEETRSFMRAQMLQIEKITKERDEFYGTLFALVEAKHEKDTNGETETYKKLKEGVWDRAFKLVGRAPAPTVKTPRKFDECIRVVPDNVPVLDSDDIAKLQTGEVVHFVGISAPRGGGDTDHHGVVVRLLTEAIRVIPRGSAYIAEWIIDRRTAAGVREKSLATWSLKADGWARDGWLFGPP